MNILSKKKIKIKSVFKIRIYKLYSVIQYTKTKQFGLVNFLSLTKENLKN